MIYAVGFKDLVGRSALEMVRDFVFCSWEK
jgi:hypothetical protein